MIFKNLMDTKNTIPDGNLRDSNFDLAVLFKCPEAPNKAMCLNVLD